MRRQTHHGIKTPANLPDLCHPKPLLYTIASGLVVGLKIFDVIIYFIII